jgi:hypothetical protein
MDYTGKKKNNDNLNVFPSIFTNSTRLDYNKKENSNSVLVFRGISAHFPGFQFFRLHDHLPFTAPVRPDPPLPSQAPALPHHRLSFLFPHFTQLPALPCPELPSFHFTFALILINVTFTPNPLFSHCIYSKLLLHNF